MGLHDKSIIELNKYKNIILDVYSDYNFSDRELKLFLGGFSKSILHLELLNEEGGEDFYSEYSEGLLLSLELASSFGDTLLEVFNFKDSSKCDVCKLSGLSVSYLDEIIEGGRVMSLDDAHLIANALDINPLCLLNAQNRSLYKLYLQGLQE